MDLRLAPLSTRGVSGHYGEPLDPAPEWTGHRSPAHVHDFWLGAGIRQFLDIGSGIPTEGNVHEVAQAAARDSRVAYVEVDPVAVAHSKVILA